MLATRRHAFDGAVADVVRSRDGVFLRHAVDALRVDEIHALLQALRACLPDRARIAVRALLRRPQTSDDRAGDGKAH